MILTGLAMSCFQIALSTQCLNRAWRKRDRAFERRSGDRQRGRRGVGVQSVRELVVGESTRQRERTRPLLPDTHVKAELFLSVCVQACRSGQRTIIAMVDQFVAPGCSGFRVRAGLQLTLASLLFRPRLHNMHLGNVACHEVFP